MSVYAIVDIKITKVSWIKEYITHVHHIVEQYGGKYLSRSANIVTVDSYNPKANWVAIQNSRIYMVGSGRPPNNLLKI